jgi:hypothetical protein
LRNESPLSRIPGLSRKAWIAGEQLLLLARWTEKTRYGILSSKRLQQFKLCWKKLFGKETDFLTKTTVLGIFDFRAFLQFDKLTIQKVITFKTVIVIATTNEQNIEEES